jgi:hypothetical protein
LAKGSGNLFILKNIVPQNNKKLTEAKVKLQTKKPNLSGFDT